MTTLSAPPAVGQVATVVVHCGGLRGSRLERRIRSVTSTVPDRVRVIATTLTPAELRPGTARHASVLLLGDDGGLSALHELVTRGEGLVVLPYVAEVVDGWLADVIDRIQSHPSTISVGRVGGDHVFVYPPGLTNPAALRELWPDCSRITGRAGAAGQPVAVTTHRTLGAVLIVKNEEGNLGACLEALGPLVDEVVVYDTGSTDGTLDIARRHGATVVEGHWDNDFGAARNRAMAHCTTDWLLSVDADEVAVADPRELRFWLDQAPGTLSLVRIISTTWEGEHEGYESRAVRLAARQGARWEGALHEQLTSNGVGPMHSSAPAPLLLRHSGYSATALAGKRGRNAAIVRGALEVVEAGSMRQRELVAHLVRALLSTHEPEDAKEAGALAETLLSEPCTHGNMAQVARVMAQTSIIRGDSRTAERWVEVARTYGESPGQCMVWNAAIKSAQGDDISAQRLLEAALVRPEDLGRDYWGTPYDADAVEVALAEVDLRLGAVASAARRILRQLEAHPETIGWSLLVKALGGAGWTLGDLAARAPEAFITRSLREALTMPHQISLVWFAALVEVRPHDHRPVIAGCVVAARSTWADAAEWETLARRHGLPGVHPLRDWAADPGNHLPERILAWALVWQGFGDADAEQRTQALRSAADDATQRSAVALLSQHVPSALAPQ